jgi:hypothetical protein
MSMSVMSMSVMRMSMVRVMNDEDAYDEGVLD